MKRNLESRVEVLVPVEDPRCAPDAARDPRPPARADRNAWDMQSDGSYVRDELPTRTIAAASRRFRLARRS